MRLPRFGAVILETPIARANGTIASPYDKAAIENLVGSTFIGCILDVFCQAIIFAQFQRYLVLHGKQDSTFLRWTVYVLIPITTLKSLEVIVVTWNLAIRHAGDLIDALQYLEKNAIARANPIMEAIICLYVQAFFAQRLWILSRKWWLVLGLLSLSVAQVAGAALYVVFTRKATGGPIEAQKWLILYSSLLLASNVLLTLSMAYHLLKFKKDVSPQTGGILQDLLRNTFLTCLPSTLCVLVSLILGSGHTDKQIVRVVAVSRPQPKIFVISMLWLLNARTTIRMKERHVHMSSVTDLAFTPPDTLTISSSSSRGARKESLNTDGTEPYSS